MITLRRKCNKILENDIENDVIEIKDSNLLQMKNNIIKQKIAAKDEYDKKIKKFNDQLLQLSQKQEQLNIQAEKAQQINNSSNQSQQENVNEGKNHKHEILSAIIRKVNNDLDLSYSLSENEISRMARKIVDVINANRNNNNLLNDIHYELKKYCLNHNKISLSQSELNKFLNEFEKNASESNYNIISNIFKNIQNKIYFDDDTNIDELEAELQYLNIDVIDEDLYNNELTIEFPKNYNKNEFKELLNDLNLLKNNSHLFS